MLAGEVIIPYLLQLLDMTLNDLSSLQVCNTATIVPIYIKEELTLQSRELQAYYFHAFCM